MFNDLNDENFLLYAMKAYDSPNCVMCEFGEDLNRIQYIKRLITKFYKTGELKERLLINHIIIIYNVFGVEAATRILFFKIDDEELRVLKPFLIYLNYLPKVVKGIRGKDIISSEIPMDLRVVRCLRNIK
jgi:hypothetical protein